ncbi:MAG: ABC transporter permease, partial [Solirubrobacteraceae bacterium]
MPGWISELGLGARLALIGGPDSRARAALTAAGVALGVMLLLLASSVPHAINAHEERDAARTLVQGRGPTRLLALEDDVDYDGHTVTAWALQATRRDPPLPPGIRRLPGRGEMVVSPALESLLRSSGGAGLARVLHARVIGTIGKPGLSGPDELFVYRGASDLRQRPDAQDVTSVGAPGGHSSRSPIVTLLAILIVIALLLPIGVFVATASRFGSEQRDQRLAALRLLGADRASTARIAAGEALLGALGGVIAGWVLFELARPLVPHVQIAGISMFATDVRPSVLLAALVVVLVPASSMLFALAAMRQVAVEPLGVTRRGRPRRRRLAWRLTTPLLGFGLLLPLIGGDQRLGTTSGQVEISAGVVLVLVGVCALLPWLVEAAIVRAGAGPLPWLLAVRRLRADHGTSGRVVAAIGLTVAGAIALQTVFSAATTQANALNATSVSRNTVQISDMVIDSRDAVGLVNRRLNQVDGLTRADALAYVPPSSTQPATIAPCALITQIATASRCVPGSAFIVNPGRTLRPGQLTHAGKRAIRVPSNAQIVRQRPAAGYSYFLGLTGLDGLTLTPRAAARLGLQPTVVEANVQLDQKDPVAMGRLDEAVASLDPLAVVQSDSAVNPADHVLDQLRRALVAGACA